MVAGNFGRSELEVGQGSPAVVDGWRRYELAKYRSAARAQQLTSSLLLLGASAALVQDALRISALELAHAELCHAVMRGAGGVELPAGPRDAAESLARHGESVEGAVVRFAVEFFCLGAAVAGRVFEAALEACTVSAARRALECMAEAERRREAFGWAIVGDGFMRPGGAALRQEVACGWPAMLVRLRSSFRSVPFEEFQGSDDSERDWGLPGCLTCCEILDKTLLIETIPRFASYGIDATLGAADVAATPVARSAYP